MTERQTIVTYPAKELEVCKTLGNMITITEIRAEVSSKRVSEALHMFKVKIIRKLKILGHFIEFQDPAILKV